MSLAHAFVSDAMHCFWSRPLVPYATYASLPGWFRDPPTVTLSAAFSPGLTRVLATTVFNVHFVTVADSGVTP